MKVSWPKLRLLMASQYFGEDGFQAKDKLNPLKVNHYFDAHTGNATTSLEKYRW